MIINIKPKCNGECYLCVKKYMCKSTIPFMGYKFYALGFACVSFFKNFLPFSFCYLVYLCVLSRRRGNVQVSLLKR